MPKTHREFWCEFCLPWIKIKNNNSVWELIGNSVRSYGEGIVWDIMAKKARIVHELAEKIDFAPGVENVALRKDDVEFYATETFHSSPFYNRTVPLLIKDIANSHNLLDIYGYRGMAAQNDRVVLINNHPVRKIRIVGRITEYFIKEIRKDDYYFLTVDDSSGNDLSVMLSYSKMLEIGLEPSKCYYTLIELTGFVKTFNGRKEFHPDFIQILNNTETYLDDEVQFWKDALRMHDILKIPWYQTSQINDNEQREVRLDEKAYQEKLIRQRLNLGGAEMVSKGIVLDSHIYTKKNQDDYSHVINSDSESEKDGEIEQITNQIFIQSTQASLPDPIPSSPISKSPSTGWVNIEATPIKIMKPEIQFKFQLIKWIIKNKEKKFNLNKPYKDPKINSMLKNMANMKFPLQVIDLTNPNVKIKSMNDLKGEIFHENRHELQVWNLIRCTKSKECHCTPILKLFNDISSSLDKIKFLNSQGEIYSIISTDYIHNFNNETGLKIQMNTNLLNLLIQWCIIKKMETGWKFNRNTMEWQATEQNDKRKLAARG